MRLFVAVNLPAEVRLAIAEAAAVLRPGLPVRWTPPEGLHLTLKFLGEVADGLAAPLGDALAGAVAGLRPFEVGLGGFGAFPSLQRPRVLWVGVERHPALELLANDVETAVGSFGFESELRPFQPHLTVGRVERGARPAALRPLAERAGRFAYGGVVRVESVELMRSTLAPTGARYSVVRRAGFGGAG